MNVRKFLNNPYLLVNSLGNRGLLNWMDDATYLKLKFRGAMGKPLDLKEPKTFNEKLQWLKIYDRNPQYTALVDKSTAKDYVKKIIGEEYTIPTYGVWDSFDQIDFDSLPNQFVLKCTHDSGGILICKDKSKLDLEAARDKMEKALKRDFYPVNREWYYSNVKPRLIAERYMEDSRTGELRDYKYFCFDGVPKLVFVATDRQTEGEETKFDFFDMDYHHIDVRNGHPNASVPPEKPQNFELMKELAGKLSAGLPHVRVDFYEVDGQVYFGEMTFYHFSGMVPFEPEIWDETIGSWLVLPKAGDKKCNKVN